MAKVTAREHTHVPSHTYTETLSTELRRINFTKRLKLPGIKAEAGISFISLMLDFVVFRTFSKVKHNNFESGRLLYW